MCTALERVSLTTRVTPDGLRRAAFRAVIRYHFGMSKPSPDDPVDFDSVAISRTTTEPLRMSYGDRVAVENRVHAFEMKVNQHIDDHNKAADVFYKTRMMPLEETVNRKVRLMWFIAGLAVAAILVAVATFVTVICVYSQ